MTNLPTAADDFDGAPPPMGFFSPTNHVGALALFVPKQFVAQKEFSYGVKDATISAIWVIQGEGAGCFWANADVAGVKMASQLSAKIGGKVLGRIVKEPGTGNRAYVIAPPTEEDKRIASIWMDADNHRAQVAEAQQAKPEPVLASAGATAGGLPVPPPVTTYDTPPF